MGTKKDYTFDFKVAGTSYGEITVPAGTLLTHMTATGIDKNYHYVADFDWIRISYPSIAKILTHDVKHYGINVPVEYVEWKGTGGEAFSVERLDAFKILGGDDFEKMIASVYTCEGEGKHNTELIVDAFNTHKNCGMLPSELWDQLVDIREEIKQYK